MTPLHQLTLMGAIVVGVASSGLTAWLMSPDSSSETTEGLASYETSYSEQPALPPQRDPAVAEQMMKMRAQIAAMDKRLVELASENVNSSGAPVMGNSAQTEPPKVQPDDTNQALQQHVAQIANRFQMEETDAAWADNVAVEIQGAFLAEGILGNSSLNNVDCRTSLCKLDVSFNDIDGLANVRNKLVETVGETLPYGAIQPGGSDNEVTIYLGNKSEAFAPETSVSR